jgi:iron-sulfur cluster assembly protein
MEISTGFEDIPQEGFMAITMDGVELGVTITEKAAEKIKYFGAKDGITQNIGLRVAVKGGGCSGLTYDLAITVKVMVDKKSYIFLVGTQLDFSDGLNGKGFVFSNPNAKKSCGCGTSFSV